MSQYVSPRGYQVITATRRCCCADSIEFHRMCLDDIPQMMPLLAQSECRTCDFTIGGTLMWAEYFDYSLCILRDTLYIKGVTEDDVTLPAFSLPIGDTPLSRSIDLLRRYCDSHGAMPLRFSAVPEQYIDLLLGLGAKRVTPLPDWSDYLYSIQTLATLTGKKLGKKRNHVNRFADENPGYTFTPLTPALLPEVRDFYRRMHLAADKPALADIEREQVFAVLDRLDRYPFEGAVLATPGHGIVAFTLGEVIGDTLYTHIEKMDHTVEGSGETVNKLFAEMMLASHPQLLWVNREEDTGDPGLRAAKLSYHPAQILTKYNVEM